VRAALVCVVQSRRVRVRGLSVSQGSSTSWRSRVIESLGYKPSRTARNLSLGLKGCIGVVVDSIQDPWFTQLLTGMEEELQSRDTLLADRVRPEDHLLLRTT
jgi:hypothetical protein